MSELWSLALLLGGLAALQAIPLGAWLVSLRRARRVAEALGLEPEPGHSRWRPRYGGKHGRRGLRLRLASTWLGRRHWLVLETDCATPPMFTFVAGEADLARARGVRAWGLKPVPTGRERLDRWADPHANDTGLASALLGRCSRDLEARPSVLWYHGGRAGLGVLALWLRHRDAPALARALARRAEDLEACAAMRTTPSRVP